MDDLSRVDDSVSLITHGVTPTSPKIILDKRNDTITLLFIYYVHIYYLLFHSFMSISL